MITRVAGSDAGDPRPLTWEPAPGTLLRMWEDAGLGDGARVLEIGTGGGFGTAVLRPGWATPG
ncbi:hypothetical protein NKH77_49400 [Streptomyces sp. M19]